MDKLSDKSRGGSVQGEPRKVDVRLPGKGNLNSHGARPVHLIITMIKWIGTSRLSTKNSVSLRGERAKAAEESKQPPVRVQPKHALAYTEFR